MGKKSKRPAQKKSFPFVSICTPTFNRRPFFTAAIECYLHQDYPRDRLEWIIIDDGTDKIKDLVEDVRGVRYFAYDTKMPLGRKRNIMHEKSKGDIIVYHDDDDYYPRDRVSHAVQTLMNSTALAAGSSEIYIWFKHIQQMYQFGPYSPTHATAGTFAFKRELLKTSSYKEDACIAEERAFLKDYTVPFVQLDPMKTILVFSHEHNTFDKRRLLEGTPNAQYCKPSTKTVDDFVSERNLKLFFMETINELLDHYSPGHPREKPDVLKQISEIEKQRAEQAMKNAENEQKIQIERPDGTSHILENSEILELLTSQQGEIARLNKLHETYDPSINVQMSDGTTTSLLLSSYMVESQKAFEMVNELKNENHALNEKLVSTSVETNLESLLRENDKDPVHDTASPNVSLVIEEDNAADTATAWELVKELREKNEQLQDQVQLGSQNHIFQIEHGDIKVEVDLQTLIQSYIGLCAKAYENKVCQAKKMESIYHSLLDLSLNKNCDDSENMIVVVNSHRKSLGLSRALQTINVPSNRLVVVVGDSDCTEDYQISKTDTHLEVLVKHNSIDFTGMIAIIDHLDQIKEKIGNFDVIFYVHDTCTFDEGFYMMVSNLSKVFENKTVRLRSTPGMNMGFYNVNDLLSLKCELYAKRSTDTPAIEEALSLKENGIFYEDFIFKQLEIIDELVNVENPNQFMLDKNFITIYENGAPRIVEYFKPLGLKKYKANYGQYHKDKSLFMQ